MGVTNARGGIRTHTARRPKDFKSQASTSFATRADGLRNLARAAAPRFPRATGKAAGSLPTCGVSRPTSTAGWTTSLGGIVGACARRLAVIACFLVPSALRAQLPAVGVPRGGVRVDLDGVMAIWDHRWLDGERQPLAADLTSPALGSDLIPTLAAADALVGGIIGAPAYRLNLGSLTGDAQQEDTRGYLGLALGLTSRITVFGRMPLVPVRTEAPYAR